MAKRGPKARRWISPALGMWVIGSEGQHVAANSIDQIANRLERKRSDGEGPPNLDRQ